MIYRKIQYSGWDLVANMYSTQLQLMLYLPCSPMTCTVFFIITCNVTYTCIQVASYTNEDCIPLILALFLFCNAKYS